MDLLLFGLTGLEKKLKQACARKYKIKVLWEMGETKKSFNFIASRHNYFVLLCPSSSLFQQKYKCSCVRSTLRL